MRRFVLWLRALLFRARVESEMEKEMRLHVEMETENNIRLGMSPAEARRHALVAFGGVEVAKEQVRDERQTRWLEQIAADVRFAARGFRRRPGFTLGVVMLIALGVGVNTAIFSVVNHLLLFPLPYPDGNRMVEFTATGGGGTIFITPMQSAVDEWRQRSRAVEQVVVYQAGQAAIGDTTLSRPDMIEAANVTPGALDFIGAQPVAGRDVQAADTLSDAPPVAMLSYEIWQSRFGGRQDALGKTLLVQGEPHRIIAVLPKGAKLPFSDAKVFAALRSAGGDRPVAAMAKLRRGVSIEQANRELDHIVTTLDVRTSQDPPRLQRAADWVGHSTRRIVYLMLGAVFIILVIACANVANLLMSRAWSRQREFAIRAAMGAGRARLVRQMFTESVLLSVIGGVLALLVARLTLALLVVARPQSALNFENARLEPTVLAWCVALALLTGLIFGLAPAMFVSAHRAGDSLKASTRAAAGSAGARRVRGALVIAEVALSAVLLVASGLLIRSMVAMSRADVGMKTEGLWGVSINLGAKSIGDSVARAGAYHNILERLRATPGIEGATIALGLPPSFGIGMGQVEIEGVPTSRGDSLMATSMTAARSDIFSVSGIRILAGRPFADEQRPLELFGQTGEIVVNQSFAKRFFPSGNALGARIRRGRGPWSTIVGIAADVVIPGDQRGARTSTQFYTAMGTAPRRSMLVVRSRGSMAMMLPSVEAVIRGVAPHAKIGDEQTSEQFVAKNRAMHRFLLMLLGTFAALAVLLAAFGLHAVISYAVHQRTREIGVRVALGAQSSDVALMIVGQGMRLSIAGILVGAGAAMLVATTMRALLYDVVPGDPVTMIAMAVLLVGVAAVASYAPARRALRVDPVEALRAE